MKVSLIVDPKVPQDAFLSLSASDNLFTEDPSGYTSTISSWFLLESDVHGPVEEPAYYFDPANINRLKDLDVLLLTQGWRDFKWKYSGLKYPPEYGFTVSGRARKRFADVPVENSFVNIGIFNDVNPITSYVSTDESGRFHFDGIDITGEAILVASITDNKEKLKGWLILDSAPYPPAAVKKIISNSDSVQYFNALTDANLVRKILPAFIQYSEIRSSLNRKYKLSDTIKPGEVEIIAKRQAAVESGRSKSQRYLRTFWPDREYEVTPQSKVYTNVGNLLRRRFLINPVKVFIPKQKPDKKEYASKEQESNLSESYKEVLKIGNDDQPTGDQKGDPVIMLNGLEVGWEGVEYLPIDWIDRVDFIKGRNAVMQWGIRARAGVVSVVMKSDILSDNVNVVYHSVRKKFSGYSEPRIFYSPKHHSSLQSDYKPDLRTTLFWEPNLKVENNKNIALVYYNGDNPGTVKITMEGITTNGIPVTGTTEYKVR